MRVRYPDEVERRPDIIAAVRHPGGMSDNFLLDGMSAKKNSEYDIPGWNERCHVSQGRGSHATLFREDPTLLTFYFYVSLDQRPITTQLCFNSVTIFKLQDSQSRVIWLDLCRHHMMQMESTFPRPRLLLKSWRMGLIQPLEFLSNIIYLLQNFVAKLLVLSVRLYY